MKEKLKKNKYLVAAVAFALVAVLSVVTSAALKNRKVEVAPENKPGVSDTSGSEKGSEKDAGEVTEEDTGKTAENNTENTTESTTAERNTEKVTEKTTQKPANTTTTTKKPVNTAKEDLVLVYGVRNQEPYSEYVTPEEADRRDLEGVRFDLYAQYGGEEGYRAHLQEIANEKCPGCGNHNCPSMEYHKNRLGDIDNYCWVISKCPQYGNIKCSHCGKILVDVLVNEEVAKFDANPDKYCIGNCYVSFKQLSHSYKIVGGPWGRLLVLIIAITYIK